MRRLIIYLAMLVLIAPASFAVGMMGSDFLPKVDFRSNAHYEFGYSLITTSDAVMDYQFIATGDMAEYVSFDPPYLEKIPPGGGGAFRIILDFPEEADVEPGIHIIEAGVFEGQPVAEGQISAKTGVAVLITVRVLYPTKYLVAKFKVPDGNINELIPLEIDVENWGELDIEKVYSIIRIYDSSGNLVKTVTTNEKSLPSAQGGKLIAHLDTLNMQPDDYKAIAEIFWDGQKTVLEDAFRLGELKVSLVSMTSVFIKDKINPLNMTVKSHWNGVVTGVYATINIAGSSLQTPTISLSPWQEAQLQTYWDAKEVPVSKYNAEVKLYFADGSILETVPVEVVEEEKKPAVVEKPIKTSTGLGLPLLILMAIVLLFLILNIILWLHTRRKHE